MSGERLCEIGGFWLSKRERSPFWQITWFDTAARQTRRASTGTGDFEKAQVRLAEHVAGNAARKKEETEEAYIAILLERYEKEHGSKIASRSTIKHAISVWMDYWQEKTVSEMTVKEQKAFIYSLLEKGYKSSYVERIMSVGRAALRRAWHHEELVTVPAIVPVPVRSDVEKAPILTKAEVATLIATAYLTNRSHLLWFIYIALNTLARPDAVLDLRPDRQVNVEARVIYLNPPGRPLTKKGRPIVPISDALLPLMEHGPVIHILPQRPLRFKSPEITPQTRFVNWHGHPVEDIGKAFRTLIRASGLNPKISPYSLRRTMATELRARGVPRWEVEGLLGHKLPGLTDEYAEFAPDYLMIGRQKIDEYMSELRVALALHFAEKVQ